MTSRFQLSFTFHHALAFHPSCLLAQDMVPVGWSTCTGPADRTWDLWETKGHPLKHHGQHWLPEFGQWLPCWLETAVQFPVLSYPDGMFYPKVAAASFWMGEPQHLTQRSICQTLLSLLFARPPQPNPTNTGCIGKEWSVLSGSLALAQHLHHWVGISIWKSVSCFQRQLLEILVYWLSSCLSDIPWNYFMLYLFISFCFSCKCN